MTIIAAAAFTAAYFFLSKSKAVFNTMLMFWGAAIMWSIDSVRNVINGEPFFTIDREDTILGFIILGAGLLFFVLSFLHARMKRS